ncbi:MAG: DEAD/DEAH box helicase [Candidatus Sumerlaeaceae bacterium]|nr:DEAD/DEAH box helicase [Candidatus Sumerlaeaceae bacterium]
MNLQNPLIVQSDMSVLLETMGPLYEEVRDFLSQFAELRKSPEYLHTYALTPLSLWNAASAGLKVAEIVEGLEKYSKYDVPPNVITEVRELMRRFGTIKLVKNLDTGDEILVSKDVNAISEIMASPHVRAFVENEISANEIKLKPGTRGRVKQVLIKLGYPVEDLAGYVEGDKLEVELREQTIGGRGFGLREYQRDASEIFYAGGSTAGGSGVLVLPCGAGKTVIGMACMTQVRQHTLILTTNLTALRQWRREILDKTSLREEEIGEYSGEIKDVKPVTLTTYQILTYKRRKNDAFLHMDLFQKYNWGLIIYDEVHLLPAPVFRAASEIQARRRLGLTATLVREDGKEDEVFSLIGPKKYDKPWKELERQGWIAKALCMEIRVPMKEELRHEYAVAELRNKYRISMENPNKIPVVTRLLEKHKEDQVLIIGQYLDQLEQVRAKTGAPIITGETPNDEREVLYAAFKKGEIKVLIVSKVANFAVDLPDASVAIQISGTYRSRQEETQRLGRVLRPKSGDNNAFFYSVVTRDTKDQECAKNRSLFLTEQGYRYRITILNEENFDKADFSFEEAEEAVFEPGGAAEEEIVEEEEAAI